MKEPRKYISFDDAAEIMGLSATRVRKLIQVGEIRTEGNKKKPLLAWEDVTRIAQTQTPPWALLTDELIDGTTDPDRLLLHSSITESVSGNFEANRLVQGNCIEFMRSMPSNVVQTVITSPPYWGVRRYPGDQEIEWSDGVICGFGAETTVQEYIRHSMEIIRHIKRVLRDDGVIWWNIGDTYHTRAHIREGSGARLEALEGLRKDGWKDNPNKRTSSGHDYLKDKDLTLIPFQFAIGAQHIGLWVRSIIVWEKENVLPDSAKDRPTTSHEYIIMMSKSSTYSYDYGDAKIESEFIGEGIEYNSSNPKNLRTVWRPQGNRKSEIELDQKFPTIWTFPTAKVEHGNHSAAFPEELPRRCISLSSKPGDIVFDPFTGSGTTLVAAKRLSRQYLGCEISKGYIEEAKKRLLSAVSRNSKRYPTNLTNDQWEKIAHLFDNIEGRKKPRKLDMRDIVDAIFYKQATCCKWHLLPKDFPNFQSVRIYFERWSSNGKWQHLIELLTELPEEHLEESADGQEVLGNSISVGSDGQGVEQI